MRQLSFCVCIFLNKCRSDEAERRNDDECQIVLNKSSYFDLSHLNRGVKRDVHYENIFYHDVIILKIKVFLFRSNSIQFPAEYRLSRD